RETGAHAVTQREQALVPRLAAAALVLIEAHPCGHCRERGLREWPEASGVQVGEALEHRKLAPRLLEGQSITRSTGAWSERTRPWRTRRARSQRTGGLAERPRTRTWSMPVGEDPSNPHSGVVRSASVWDWRTLTLKSPASTAGSSGRATPSTNTAALSSSASARRLSGA